MRADVFILTVVCALLTWSTGASQTRANETADAVDDLVARKAAILETMHDKAGKALVRVAQDESFRNYFLASSADERAAFKERIERISLAVQARFHVAEMCLINRDGAEIARIVDKRVADDLSLEEAQTIFFEPGFALGPRGIHVSPLYMSADADRWVVGYVTPIDVNGATPAILHYEHSLAIYQEALNRGMEEGGEDRFVVAVGGDGRVVSDSRRAVPVEKRDGLSDRDAYFERFELAGLGADALVERTDGCRTGVTVPSADGGGYAVACRTVEHWMLFAVERL